jgi:DNA-binding transcriptional ArsR family regulator
LYWLIDLYFISAVFNQMVEYSNDELNAILKAVADPTRRSVLTTLVQQGPSRVTDLAAHYDMTLWADNFNGTVVHLNAGDVSMVAISTRLMSN